MHAIAGGAMLALLAGCGGLKTNAEPDVTYVLHAAPAQADGAVNGVLAVLRPAVQPGLDTDRIALVRSGNELAYYAASRWGEPLPKVITALALEAFDGGFVTVVSAERAAVATDFELLLTARHFEADYTAGSPPVAHVAFDCVLTAGTPRRVLGRCDAEASEPAAADRMGEIVAALERAARQALATARAGAVAAATRK